MEEKKPNANLDLRGVVCPINFVKTKLKLEEMNSGEILEIVIDPGRAYGKCAQEHQGGRP